jgi:thiol:disulfide interchange protein DsbD
MLSSLNQWVEGQLSSGSTGMGAFFFLFVGGALASLLPCTYPLYPISVSVLRARAGGNRPFMHPLAYYLGLASVYFGFGLLAGLTGAAFNEFMRYPMTNLGIAGLLLVMGLGAGGWLHLPGLGAADAGRFPGLGGTFLLGAAAGILASSCVGPVVVSVLVSLASQAQAGLSATLAAALKMLAFGLGLGLPFLLIGVFGLRLPKAGRWMSTLQGALGLLILYFAYTYLEKALLTWGFSPEAAWGVGLGSLAFLLAAQQLQPLALTLYQRTARALWALLGVVSILTLFRAFAPAPAAQGAGPLAMQPALQEQKGNLTWFLDREAAYSAAKAQGKSVFIDFYGNWCANCKAFEQLSQQDTALNRALDGAVLLKIYDTSPLFAEYREDPRFPELKVGLPFFLITDPEGSLLYKTSDYLRTDEMALFLMP